MWFFRLCFLNAQYICTGASSFESITLCIAAFSSSANILLNKEQGLYLSYRAQLKWKDQKDMAVLVCCNIKMQIQLLMTACLKIIGGSIKAASAFFYIKKK